MLKLKVNASSTEQLYAACKDKLLRALDSDAKSVKLCGSDIPASQILAIARQLHSDPEIKAALEKAGVIGHLDYKNNRYAQGPFGLTFRKTISKKGISGWSTWF